LVNPNTVVSILPQDVHEDNPVKKIIKGDYSREKTICAGLVYPL